MTTPDGPKTIPELVVRAVAGTAVCVGLISGTPWVLLAVGNTTLVGTPPLDDTGLGLPIGTLAVKVVWSFEMVTGTVWGAPAWVCCAPGLLVTAPPSNVEIAPPGLLMGTSVVRVVSELLIVIGTDRTGTAPLDKPASAVDKAPRGFVTGTWAVNVVSGSETTIGRDMTGFV